MSDKESGAGAAWHPGHRRMGVRQAVRKAVLGVAMVVGAMSMTACDGFLTGKKNEPPPIEYSIASPYRGVKTMAIAPAVNQSGNRDFDVLSVSDSLFGELQQVGGLNVLPLNKTLAAMHRLKVDFIDSPATAQKVAALLGADGIVIPAITAYDPYNPPVVGMTLQFYTVPGSSIHGEAQPADQISAVFNASNQTVLRELRDFSQGRTQYDSALQDQRFLMDADAYMRFVCHAMVRRLMEVERVRASGR